MLPFAGAGWSLCYGGRIPNPSLSYMNCPDLVQCVSFTPHFDISSANGCLCYALVLFLCPYPLSVLISPVIWTQMYARHPCLVPLSRQTEVSHSARGKGTPTEVTSCFDAIRTTGVVHAQLQF